MMMMMMMMMTIMLMLMVMMVVYFGSNAPRYRILSFSAPDSDAGVQ